MNRHKRRRTIYEAWRKETVSCQYTDKKHVRTGHVELACVVYVIRPCRSEARVTHVTMFLCTGCVAGQDEDEDGARGRVELGWKWNS
ncbi:hypothetical protein L195_g026729 [Trifolium pratense]|uniref:Uncharacterized protein n=1 Tax=Trifolium pratense TaxID=57577 RepID=A0A2K3NK28_TRIPR|nr:hypothetical protein L195_g026729 [Trifolium pratense]